MKEFGFLFQLKHSNNNNVMEIFNYTLFTEFNPINFSETASFLYIPNSFFPSMVYLGSTADADSRQVVHILTTGL
jgi:hypothetical protein